MSTQDLNNTAAHSGAADSLGWLTPRRARLILVLFLVLGFFSKIWFLHTTTLDLVGDEAQYWDWSRRLELSYYSKGPLIAYLIRASCWLFGDTMQAVRYPAVVLAMGTSVVTFLLTRKLFGSDRLALGAVLLNATVPMFIAGSVMMTIDSPFYFCWALTTYLGAIAIFDKKPWIWPIVGVVVGVGFLAKYAMFIWLLPACLMSIAHRHRRGANTLDLPLSGVVIAALVAVLFTTPVVLWNYRHNWVTLKHVGTQTGATKGGFDIRNVLEMIGTQFGLLGPALAVLVIGAVVYALRGSLVPLREGEAPAEPGANRETDTGSAGASPSQLSYRALVEMRREYDVRRPQMLYLLWIGLTFLSLTFIASFRAKVQPNWPAPSYFTLLVLTAYFISTRFRSNWKSWRGWFWGAVATGIILQPIGGDPSILFPIVQPVFDRFAKKGEEPPSVAAIDITGKLRGWKDLGRIVSQERDRLSPGAFVFCDDYQQTAEMAFYVEGQPITYCVGPYKTEKPSRLSQYDMWPDHRLDAYPGSPLIGHDAIFVGKGGEMPAGIAEAFDSMEQISRPDLTITVRGIKVKEFRIWRCRNFKGMPPLKHGTKF